MIYKNSSQPYSATSLETVLKSSHPKGCNPEDRRILFSTYMPDEEVFCVFQLTEEQIQKAMDKLTKENTDEQDKNGSET